MNDSIKREQSELAHFAERENLRTKCKYSIKREQSELAHAAERENLRPKGKKIITPWHYDYLARITKR